MRVLITILTFTAMLLTVPDTLRAQSIWTATSIKIQRDSAALENMQGATPLDFSGNIQKSSANIPINGFKFRFGLGAFDHFYASASGFIKFGSAITDTDPRKEDTVISGLYSGTVWEASYKLFGNAPDRRLVIEFKGGFYPTGEPTSFQIWLHEQNGKIQLVYEGLKSYDGYPSDEAYKIFCKQTILGKAQIASVRVTDDALQQGYYGAYLGNTATIKDNLRFTFQPDIHPVGAPNRLEFANVRPGCMDYSFLDNASNETLIQVETAAGSGSFQLLKQFFPGQPSENNTYSEYLNQLKSSTNYTFRVFATNGFLCSDTVVRTIQTPAASITGTIKIPGDFPTITEMLSSATDCKHFGGNVIVELQKDYAPEKESYPLTFNRNLRNPALKQLTIRPAIGADIQWKLTDPRKTAFVIDSVKNIVFDGRPGGTGTARNLSFIGAGLWGILSFINGADSCTVNYCNISMSDPSPEQNTDYLVGINVGNYKYPNGQAGKFISGMTISNCSFNGEGEFTSNGKLISVGTTDTLGIQNTMIIDNEFFNFTGYGIFITNRADKILISGNRFYQPKPSTSSQDGASISLINVGDVQVEDNLFGGNSKNWGYGQHVHKPRSDESYFCINFKGDDRGKAAFFRRNKFAGFDFDQARFELLHAEGNEIYVDNNVFGTKASRVVSSRSSGEIHLVGLLGKKVEVRENLFDGFRLTSGQNFLLNIRADSSVVERNRFGSNNQVSDNTANGSIYLTNCSGFYSEISENEFVGFYSSSGSVTGIGTDVKSVKISNNLIHHLKAAHDVYGVNAGIKSEDRSVIFGNSISALFSEGLQKTGHRPRGVMVGINAYDKLTEENFKIPFEKKELRIFNNKINSFVPTSVDSMSVWELHGIGASAQNLKVYNNAIAFGMDMRGRNIDTNMTNIMGIAVGSHHEHPATIYVEHNTVFIGGYTRYESAGIGVTYFVSGPKKFFVSNNIIQIDRGIIPGLEAKHTFLYKGEYITQSRNNLWYSSTDKKLAATLKAFKDECKCDEGSFIGDPQLFNPMGDSSSISIVPAAGGMANGRGFNSFLGINADIDGKDRNQYSPVDIGSYVVGPCPNPSALEILAPVGDSLFICPDAGEKLIASTNGPRFTKLQWQKDFTDIETATDSTININSEGVYRIVGTNGCGSVASRSIVVVAGLRSENPIVTITASDTVICTRPTEFSAIVSNSTSIPVYQWKVNGINVGENSPKFSPSTIRDKDIVSVSISTGGGCIEQKITESNAIQIRVVTESPMPTIEIINPAGGDKICEGTQYELTLKVSNAGVSPRYEWRLNQNIVGTGEIYIAKDIKTGDKLIVSMTTNTNCSTDYKIFSEELVFEVTPMLTPSAVFSASTRDVQPGGSTKLSVKMVNAGEVTLYNWIELYEGETQFRQIQGADHLSPTHTYTPTFSPTINSVKVSGAVMMTGCLDRSFLSLDTITITKATESPRTGGASPRIYPNPVYNELVFDSLNISDEWQSLQIFNLSGSKKIATVSLINAIRLVLPVHTFEKGLYVAVFVKKNGERLRMRFMKL